MKKRILSMILVISTLLSLCCISVYAKAPGVTTLEPDDITEDSVVLRGTVTSNSGIRIKEYGFQLVYQGNVSTYRFYDGEDYEYPDPINNDVIEYEVDGLRDSSEYAVVFYAVNYNGEKNFGKSVYFETEGDDEEPEIMVTEKDDGYYNSDYYEDEDDDDYDYEDDYDDEDSYIVQQPVKLSTPNAKADSYTIYEGETVTVSWNSVSNADYYTVWDFTRNVPYDNITSTSCYNIAPFNEEGTYAIGVYARSYENNIYLQSEACTFNITVVEKEIADTSNPQINTISSSAGKSFVEGTTTTFSTRASDNALSVIYMYIDGEKVETSYYETIEYKTSYLDAGSHTIKVVARDESGNESYTSITVTVEEEYEEDDYYDDDYYDYDSGYSDVSVFHNQAYSAASYYGGIKVYVNGSQLYFDVEPEITNGRTMVPLRAIFEALGAEVYWNGSTSTVTAYRDNESIELKIGSYYLYTSSGTKTLDQPGYVINGRTLVPVRAISEAFNCDVEWYGDKQLVSIVAKDKKYQTVISNGNSQSSNTNNSNFVLGERIIINGIDIGYSTGEYFSETGVECKCHGRDTCGEASDCTCIGVSKAWQCKGFAMWCQNKLFGGNEKSHSNKFKKVGSVAKGNLTEAKIKELISSAPIGSHIRTNYSPHSMILISKNEYGFTIVQANGGNNNEYSGYDNCRIGTSTYTWKSYVDSTYGQRGIDYIAVPIN